MKSISQFESHLKKCDDESSGEERRSFRANRSRRISFQGGEKNFVKTEIDSAQSITDEDRKKHLEHVKALTGDNYVSQTTLSNAWLRVIPSANFQGTVNH